MYINNLITGSLTLGSGDLTKTRVTFSNGTTTEFDLTTIPGWFDRDNGGSQIVTIEIGSKVISLENYAIYSEHSPNLQTLIFNGEWQDSMMDGPDSISFGDKVISVRCPNNTVESIQSSYLPYAFATGTVIQCSNGNYTV